MAYPTHPRHQAAREALEFSKQQQAPQEGGRVETTPGEQQVFEGMGETLTPSFAEEPREPAMGDAPPIPEVAPEAPAPEPGGPNLSEKSTEELQEGRRRLMARMMDEAKGPQLEAMQKLADSIDRELSMRHGG
jgi:hypothetical protein